MRVCACDNAHTAVSHLLQSSVQTIYDVCWTDNFFWYLTDTWDTWELKQYWLSSWQPNKLAHENGICRITLCTVSVSVKAHSNYVKYYWDSLQAVSVLVEMALPLFVFRICDPEADVRVDNENWMWLPLLLALRSLLVFLLCAEIHGAMFWVNLGQGAWYLSRYDPWTRSPDNTLL